MTEDDLEHRDIEAALETRRELGARYDAELVEGFAERIERAVERRVSERVSLEQRRTSAVAGAGPRQLALGIVSLVASSRSASCSGSTTSSWRCW